MNVKIITLCGSMKFIKEFKKTEITLTRQGFLVLTPIFGDDINISEEDTVLFGINHFKKIDLSNEIFIIDVNGYIGESTKKEIEYAKLTNKKVRYYSKEITV